MRHPRRRRDPSPRNVHAAPAAPPRPSRNVHAAPAAPPRPVSECPRGTRGAVATRLRVAAAVAVSLDRSRAPVATSAAQVGESDWFFAPRPSKLTRDALARVGLASDAAERVPPERQQGLVPVVLLLDAGEPKRRGFSGVLMGRRSGYMMGDLKELKTTGFMLQPLWIGGPDSAEPNAPPAPRTVGAPDDRTTTGIIAVRSPRGCSSDESRRRRGRDADIPWRRVAPRPRPRRG